MTEQFVLVESYGNKTTVYGFWPTRQDVMLAVRRATARSKAKNSPTRHAVTSFKGLKVRVTNVPTEAAEEPQQIEGWELQSIMLAPEPETVELDNPPAETFDALIGNEQYRTDLETLRSHLERGTFPMSGKRFWGGVEWAIARIAGLEYIAGTPYPQPLEEDLRGLHTVALYERTRSITDVGFRFRWEAALFRWLLRRTSTKHWGAREV